MPTNNVQLLLAQDIPDPTDFSELDLCQLDASFRCTICSEFFDAPVSLTCGHCFCSLCIREHLAREPECPSCRKSATESHFRVNPTLEEAVSAWQTARSNVLRLSREEQVKGVTRYQSSGDKTPRRHQTPVRNGRKRRHIEVSDSSDCEVVQVAGSSKPKLDSSPLQAKSARKASRQQTSLEPSSDPREEDHWAVDPESLVECPICGASVEFQLVNAHMDGPDCGRKTSPKMNDRLKPSATTQWSLVFNRKSKKGKSKDDSDPDIAMERLPKVSYDVLKDKQVKDLLSASKLPVNGDRNIRIARHRRWVMIYNANLDKRMGRKTTTELRVELKTWEESRKGTKCILNSSAHEVLHKEEFSRLIEDVRQRSCKPPVSDGVPRERVVEDGHE